MRSRAKLNLSSIASAAAWAAIGAWLIGASGCAAAGPAGMLASNAAPMAMTATEGVSVARGNSSGEADRDKEEDAVKCDQLQRNPPDVEEIRRTPDLAIESRELRIERGGSQPRWVVFRSRGSQPSGWRRQSSLDNLHFTPPLETMLTDDRPRFLAYSVAVPQNAQDSEKIISIADDFGPRAGSFEWRGTRYGYTVSKTLPCFAGPD